MILFVFEGKKQEPEIYRTIETLFFSGETDERIYFSYCSSIYNFYQTIKKYDLFDGDDLSLPILIKQEIKKHPDLNPQIPDFNADDISQIFLFFDYDIQVSKEKSGLQTEKYNSQVQEMISYFNDETNHGKLYINYPMVDSYRYTDELPDKNYYTYTVSISDCKRFKEILAINKPFYRNEKKLQVDKKQQYANKYKVLRDWKFINEQNISKSNYICNNQNSIPNEKGSINQDSIFKNQIQKFVYLKDCVSILNGFPLFLLEFFKDTKQILPN